MCELNCTDVKPDIVPHEEWNRAKIISYTSQQCRTKINARTQLDVGANIQSNY